MKNISIIFLFVKSVKYWSLTQIEYNYSRKIYLIILIRNEQFYAVHHPMLSLPTDGFFLTLPSTVQLMLTASSSRCSFSAFSIDPTALQTLLCAFERLTRFSGPPIFAHFPLHAHSKI